MAAFPEASFDPTFVSGYRTTADQVSIRLKPQVFDKILTYQPNGNAVALILNKARKTREVGGHQFYWMTKDRYPVRDTVNLAAGYDADDTSIVVTNGDRFFARAVVLNVNSGERMLVQSVSNNTLTIEKRGLGSTAKPIQHNDEFLILNNAYPEAADVGTAISIKEASEYNYTQTIRSPMSFSRRDMKSDMFGGFDMDTEEMWQASQHMQFIEYALLWGARDLFNDASSGKRNTTTGGIHYYINGTSPWDLNAVKFNYRTFMEFLEEAMYYGDGGRFGSRTKWLVGGSRLLTEVASWGVELLRLPPSAKVFGLDIVELRTPHGKVRLIDHPLFEGGHASKAMLLDFNHLRLTYFKDGKTSLLADRQGNGIDGKTSEWLTDVGLEVHMPLAHRYLYNLPIV